VDRGESPSRAQGEVKNVMVIVGQRNDYPAALWRDFPDFRMNSAKIAMPFAQPLGWTRISQNRV
jgi:hypothetical protein